MTKRKWPLRFSVTFIALIISFIAILGRLVFLHLIDNEKLSEKARSQQKFFVRLSP